jgi:hypothetical protein
MNDFIKEFKQLNPNVSESRTKEIYLEQKSSQKQNKTEIIKIPSLSVKPDVPVVPVVPEKSFEEIERESLEKEEKERLKELEILRLSKLKNLKFIIELWGINLSRSINKIAQPQYPLHPITKVLASPSDLFTIIRETRKHNEEFEDDNIILPFLLSILASDKIQVINIYNDFISNPIKAPEKLRSFYLSKGIKYTEVGWTPIILPPLRNEYIEHVRSELLYTFPKTIKLDEINIDNTIKSPLENVLSLHDLLEKLSKTPELLHKISDTELEFFNLSVAQIMEIRLLFAEQNKTKQNLRLKLFIKSISNDESDSEKEPESEMSGGSTGNKLSRTNIRDLNSAIMATFI